MTFEYHFSNISPIAFTIINRIVREKVSLIELSFYSTVMSKFLFIVTMFVYFSNDMDVLPDKTLSLSRWVSWEVSATGSPIKRLWSTSRTLKPLCELPSCTNCSCFKTRSSLLRNFLSVLIPSGRKERVSPISSWFKLPLIGPRKT